MPDFILLDINMPIMNGWEFLDEYKRLNIDPQGKSKIYIISSSVFSNDIKQLAVSILPPTRCCM
ncbi:hypothetical protein HK413_10490 [Mucilaginibacter sp. S1162]|uniref:Response regulatory domain-containing protein n=1 Tax=Mucilaginibacter humi TaxID=2732510 RepID=A0ABX1W3A1_9SPHI|nr:hypothetical protein [Mucilaginibacter humi]NNU34448.1 hypothetical protein [Mucilaginibacter humi]